MKLEIIAFTARGAALAEKLMGCYPESCASTPQKYCSGSLQPLNTLHEWTKSHFQTGRTLVFISAIGIAVRAVAPFIRDKVSDAAVICIDEMGENVIPLLCGHIGGANQTAKSLAESLSARVVITTATDINNAFAIDEWAVRNNCVITDFSVIKKISSALLDGEEVGLHSEFPITTELPHGITTNTSDCTKYKCGIEIAFNSKAPFPTTLHLIPRIIVAGIGCRRGVPYELMEEKLYQTLKQFDIPVEALSLIATIDLKSNESGLLALRDKLNTGFVVFSAEELMRAQGEFEHSEIVLAVTGTDNVCQRAVVCSGAKLFTGKIAEDGMSIALGTLDWSVEFEEYTR